MLHPLGLWMIPLESQHLVVVKNILHKICLKEMTKVLIPKTQVHHLNNITTN